MHGYTMYQGCILYIVIFIFEKFKQRSSTITPISKKLKTTSLLKQLYTKRPEYMVLEILVLA